MSDTPPPNKVEARARQTFANLGNAVLAPADQCGCGYVPGPGEVLHAAYQNEQGKRVGWLCPECDSIVYDVMKPVITKPHPAQEEPRINLKVPPVPVRQEILEEALEKVMGPRNQDYGSPEQHFEEIAALWNVILGRKLKAEHPVSAADVALCMDAVKTARLINSPDHRDSWVDKAGFSSCGAEVTVWPR